HVGGDIDFDAAGNLYLTTGDDTNPFESSGYAPIDERTDRNPQFDAQRSSGNTNDLRGKLLRIKPTADGGYTVPSGNLFAPGTAGTRPEIYAMGFR
ncbi:PQQ-dependent sugar dehydrogenase, partial [Streptomyces sp. SID8455]|nr:PQQ-dependent sugar dehydrogenase [Streptomyces sp. SID8455]